MFDALISQNGFFIFLGFFGIGAVGSLMLNKYDSCAALWNVIFSCAGSCVGMFFSLGILFDHELTSFNIPTSFPLPVLSFHIDYLSAFFIFLISFISFTCSLFSIGYLRQFYNKYSIGFLGFFYHTFIASMVLVVSAHNALFFLISWEIMSLISYFLVIFERNEHENIKAGSVYIVMTHIGTAFIIFSFLLLYAITGSLDFEEIKNGIFSAPPVTKSIIFILAFVGFGVKAGIIPFHSWLPSAHPAAPSHISALMSGVMVKIGLYMIIRMSFDIFSGGLPWWGLLVLILGSISSLLGVLYALCEHDIKKLLAYHTIENVGIILLGLGSSLVFLSADMKILAMIGFIAALYHTFNHAIFKALLFLGAGSVISQTHTRNIEEYGGLIKKMPHTAFYFLIGSMAISALPPLNGFASEWLTFQSLFQGVAHFNLVTKLIFIGSLGALAFTGGLALTCFVKAFGISFLARPRSTVAAHAKESGISMRSAMGILALGTILCGIFAAPIARAFAKITLSMSSFAGTDFTFTHFSPLDIGNGFASVSMPALAISITILCLMVVTFVSILCHKRTVHIERTWDCGVDLSPRMEITATSFSRSIITIFWSLLRPVKKMSVKYYDTKSQYFLKKAESVFELNDVYQSRMYRMLFQSLVATSERVKKIQSGNINGYIAYIFATLMILLFSLAL